MSFCDPKVSRRSSRSWNASPRLAPYSRTATTHEWSTPATLAPASRAATNRAPVFWAYISVSCASLPRPCCICRSRNWPAMIPLLPTDSDNKRVRSSRVCAVRCSESAMTPKAWLRSAVAARMAVSSPKTRWFAGSPRRRNASSMHGRSSRIREAVWTISIAHAGSRAAVIDAPRSVATWIVNSGRIRLPPASRL